MDDDTWHLIKHTSKVTGFVGGAKNRPAPISEEEKSRKIVNQMQGRHRQTAPQDQFMVGENGSCQGRSIHGLQWLGGRRPIMKEPSACVGDDLSVVRLLSSWNLVRLKNLIATGSFSTQCEIICFEKSR